jgi:YD repeat-containing protein
VTQYGYDTESNLLSITDAAGHITSFTYDAFGRVTRTSFPSTLTEAYTGERYLNPILRHGQR